MKTTTTTNGLRLTTTPIAEYLVATALMVIAGLFVFTNDIDSSLGPASIPWIRAGCGAMVLIGAVLFLRAERIDHRFDRSRGTIELTWRSLVRARRRVLAMRDVTGILVEEDTDSEYGRPTRIVLLLADATQVRLTEGYSAFRTPVVRASRTLSRLLGAPVRDAC